MYLPLTPRKFTESFVFASRDRNLSSERFWYPTNYFADTNFQFFLYYFLDVYKRDQVPRTGYQPSHKNVDDTGSNLNDGDLQNYRCRFCRLTFYTIEQLEEHQTTHNTGMDDRQQNADIPLNCNACDQNFTSIDLLRSHEQNLHKFSIVEEFIKCVHCQKNVAESDLDSHMSTDHKEIKRHNLSSVTKTQPQVRVHQLVPLKFFILRSTLEPNLSRKSLPEISLCEFVQ